MAVWAQALEHNCSSYSNSQRKMYGCDGTPSTITFDLGGYVVKGCPYRNIKRSYKIFFTAYSRYEKGYLPNAGGWMDQSAKFNDVIDLIEAQLAVIAQKKRDTPKK